MKFPAIKEVGWGNSAGCGLREPVLCLEHKLSIFRGIRKRAEMPLDILPTARFA